MMKPLKIPKLVHTNKNSRCQLKYGGAKGSRNIRSQALNVLR